MSIVRVGSTSPYAAGWDHVFGGIRSKSASRTKKAGVRMKKAGKTAGASSAAKPKAAKAKASKSKKAARGRK